MMKNMVLEKLCYPPQAVFLSSELILGTPGGKYQVEAELPGTDVPRSYREEKSKMEEPKPAYSGRRLSLALRNAYVKPDRR